MVDVEEIKHGGETIALIIPSGFSREGTFFFTPKEFSQQLAFISHAAGDSIQEHTHKFNKRVVTFTQEALFIKKGRVRVKLFDKNEKFIGDRSLSEGDVILLVSGGHGFEFLDDTKLIEVKQGPYSSVDDKKRFKGVY